MFIFSPFPFFADSVRKIFPDDSAERFGKPFAFRYLSQVIIVSSNGVPAPEKGRKMQRVFWVVLLLLGGCSSPQLQVGRTGDIALTERAATLFSVRAERKLSDRVNLEGLAVERTLYASGANALVLERVTLLPPYRFAYSLERSLKIVFDAWRVERLERVGNLGFYTVQLRKEGGKLLCVAENMNKRGIRMLYGLTREQTRQMVSAVGGDAAVLDSVGKAITLRLDKGVFLTKWNPKMILLDGLLKRAGGRAKAR